VQFTRLRLTGFKSFVDPTELAILPGLTGVVGPNGCGKSNLLEALRWAMGENRPSAMRGSEMEEVIFNGSARRPARASAEVAITIDNTERTAPAGFNDADLLEISRKIARDLGSAYRINGKDVRARDVQVLFADAATGAHSPALVRQGQIADLINARPRARRRVLEDAAGIAGLHQRRHEAELKLNATEANLGRVADTLDQQAQQLATLQRQARQAARYREIGAQLRRAEAALLLGRWLAAGAALDQARSGLAEALRAAGLAGRAAEAAAEARDAAEAALPPLRDEAAVAGALVARIEIEAEALAGDQARARARVRELAEQIARLQADALREGALAEDARTTLARLTDEASAMDAGAEDEGDQIAAARAAADEAVQVLRGHEAELTTATERAAALAARREAAQAALAAARADLDRATAGVARAEAEAQEGRDRQARAADEAEAAAEARAEAEAMAEAADEALALAEATRTQAQAAEAEARAVSATARGEAQALASEAGGIERLLARSDPGGAGLLPEIAVAPGYERALGAALADDLRLGRAESGTGWRALPAYGSPPDWPEGVEPLAPRVQAPPELARRLALVGVLADPARAGALQPGLAPGQRLVSAAGDLWRWDGVAVMAGGAPSAAALRLEQTNRLAALRTALDAAQARAEAAAEGHGAASDRLSAATAAEIAAREARRAAERRATEAAQAAGRALTAAEQAAARLQAAGAAIARAAEDRAAAQARLAAAEAMQGGAEDLAQARAHLDACRAAVEAARQQAGRLRGQAQALAAESEARRRRRAEIMRERADWTARAARAADRLAEIEARRDDLAETLAEADSLPADLERRRAALEGAREGARARRATASAALDQAEQALRTAQDGERAAERAAGQAREARAAAEARVEAAREGLDAAAARIADERGQSPEALMAALGPDSARPPPGDDPETEIARLKRARDALGAVNLRADEDARALQAEHDTLMAERADLEAAVARLRGAIGALNREGRERLLAAFEQVNASFAALFTHLFGGGEARLVLVESDDPLEAGLEILCQPPGKKLSSLSLLSGGEQTLTALALIFAVFLTNPSPICVLDEVDAPLDDANVARFCDLLDEMVRRTRTRFLIITHNAITMARMDRLYGVTMVEQGVSQLVSVDLRAAEAMVA